MLIGAPGEGVPEVVDLLARHGEVVIPTATADCPATVAALVRAGIGVGMLTGVAAHGAHVDGETVLLPLAEPGMVRRVSAYWYDALPGTELGRELLREVLAARRLPGRCPLRARHTRSVTSSPRYCRRVPSGPRQHVPRDPCGSRVAVHGAGAAPVLPSTTPSSDRGLAMHAFVGRTEELDVLRARLADARAGRPWIVQVQGPAGIGKTALIERFVGGEGRGSIAASAASRSGRAGSRPPTVLRASGEEAETLLAYGVLDQLARSAGPAGKALAAVSAQPSAEPFLAGSRLLELLGELESAGPVLLVVDDLHWADQPSVRALVFALRRLVADQVLVLLAVRDDAVAELPESLRRIVSGHHGAVVRVPGLDEHELRELARALGVASLPSRAARRLRDGTHGNPLHVRAVLDESPPGLWTDAGKPLPSPRSFRLLVGDRYADCGAETRDLLDAAAVLGVRAALPLAAAVGGVTESVQAVDEAVRRGLLVADTARHPWTLAFPHPLVRSALHDALGPARRTALHLAAARLVDDEVAVLHHRVAAAPGLDAALADDLVGFAHRAAARQEWPSATRHLVASGRLCPDREEGRRRLLVALTWMLQTGDAVTAATFTEELRALPASPLRDSVLGTVAMARDDPDAAQEMYESAWKQRGADSARRR